MNTPLILDGLEKRYGAAPPALAPLSLDIAGDELLGLVGPSGCGKTTALRLIAGLTPASAGRMLIGGRDVTALSAHARGIGLVFQNYALFPHMTAADNVAFGLRMRGLPAAERLARTAEALAMVRLSHPGGRKPRELSGGQQQRVALAVKLLAFLSPMLTLAGYAFREGAAGGMVGDGWTLASWGKVLGDRGFLPGLLRSLGVEPPPLVFNTTGVVIGLVEILMPHMILSLLAGFGASCRSTWRPPPAWARHPSRCSGTSCCR